MKIGTNYKEYKMGFVVLHFKVINYTINCVNSIIKIMKKDDKIIIVANSDLDNGFRVLKKRFEGEKNIFIIYSKKNIGFAKGNNLGFKILKKKYDMDFIVLLNNDTIIKQTNWHIKIVQIYEKTKFAVLGPQILNKYGESTNVNPQIPMHTKIINVRVGQVSNYIRYILSFLCLDMIYNNLVSIMQRNRKHVRSNILCENVQLSGCCLIFSREYIQKFDGLNPETFLYLEEQILYNRIKEEKMKSIYSSDIQIIHLEEGATRQLFGNKHSKARRFKYRCQMTSFKVLLKQMKSYELV